MQSTPLLYWIFWIITLLVCIQQFIYNYRKSHYFLGLPIIAIFTFSFFYIFQSFYVATTLKYFLEPWMLIIGQLVPALSLVFLLWGWYRGIRGLSASSVGFSSYFTGLSDYQSFRLWISGILLIVIAIIGQRSFSEALSTGQVTWQNTSGYWYMLPYLAYPGFLLCTQVIAQNKKYRNSLLSYIILISLSYLHLLPFILNARRGPIFPYTIMILYGFFLSPMNVRKINKVMILIGIVVTGLAMLILVSIRDYSSYGASWRPDHLQERLNFDTVVIGQLSKEGDNEFLYNCAMISTNYKLNLYQYGTGYFTLLTHWIPRQWWNSKPTLGQGIFYGNITEYVPQVTGWSMSAGAAGGGIADAFNQLGFVSLLFWFVIGNFIGRLYKAGLIRGMISRQGYLISILSCLHWLIAQGFSAAFVPLMIFLGTLKLVYSLFRVDQSSRVYF